jgi:hypothetical protein
MVYELTLQSVQIKTTIFETPAKLINYKELSCAVGMAQKQAGLPMDQLVEIGTNMKDFKEKSMVLLQNKNINEKIRFVIENYILKPDEIFDQDALITMKLGYDSIE